MPVMLLNSEEDMFLMGSGELKKRLLGEFMQKGLDVGGEMDQVRTQQTRVLIREKVPSCRNGDFFVNRN